jgi:hypothetical protein
LIEKCGASSFAGHRILPRWDFIRLLKQYRGSFLAPPPAGAEVSRACAQCGVEEPSPQAHKACARCGAVYYCSRDCQTAHWKKKGGDHKSKCVPKAEGAAGGAGSATAVGGDDGFSVLEMGDGCATAAGCWLQMHAWPLHGANLLSSLALYDYHLNPLVAVCLLHDITLTGLQYHGGVIAARVRLTTGHAVS